MGLTHAERTSPSGRAVISKSFHLHLLCWLFTLGLPLALLYTVRPSPSSSAVFEATRTICLPFVVRE